ncbi:hypothetical protein KVR01_006873 [Diaporthe batatas]|uniref:uncharacterized protein n=1 Tax=Diaporthe batatas TaxID=748121 RepID=UPI001D0591C3|nr:uncharacterized protein KVR01_006873 [Diaporthe batatas]KAG8163576.1 hypothetical protein KVR01_006873 [Diaporthe batatas]
MDREDHVGNPRTRLEKSVQQLRSQLQLVRPSRGRVNKNDGGQTVGSVKGQQPGNFASFAEAEKKHDQKISQFSPKLKGAGTQRVKGPEKKTLSSDFEGLNAVSSLEEAEFDSGPQEETEWQPSLVIGSSSIDTGNPSAKEVARRNMLQWEHIHQHHRKQSPGSFQLNILDKRRQDAVREYEDICARADPEDDVPRNETRAFKEERIQSRLCVLQETLAQSTEPECEPMRANISAAIRGYQEGDIECSSTYTLIFAGKIVDTTCRTWAEFAIDRKKRLDEYFDKHGPGFLWWEPPLADGKDGVNAKKALLLDVKKHVEPDVQFRDDQCHLRIPMCFRKENALTCRMEGTEGQQSILRQGASDKPRIKKRKWVRVDDDESCADVLKKARGMAADAYEPHIPPERAAKKGVLSQPFPASVRSYDTSGMLTFEMLLDSDFVSLGFTKNDMNAASVTVVHGANGKKSSLKLFELLAGVQLSEDCSHDHDLFPTQIIKLDWMLKPPAGYSGERLSGILPFLAYYMSFAPGMDIAHLGDERGDVLGMQRIPAGLRYDPFVKLRLGEHRERLFKKLQHRNPSKIVFEHRRGSARRTLVEEEVDSDAGTSRITLLDTDGTVMQSCKIETPQDRRRQRLVEFVE